MKKIFLAGATIGIVILLFVFRGLNANPGAAPTQTGVTTSSLSDSPRYSFGTISMARGKVAHTFQFTNDTGAPLAITRLITSCMCTAAYLTTAAKTDLGPFGMPGHSAAPTFSEVIASGERFEIKTVFDPAAHGPAGIGKVDREATLSTDRGDVVVRFDATVTP